MCCVVAAEGVLRRSEGEAHVLMSVVVFVSKFSALEGYALICDKIVPDMGIRDL